MNLPKTKAMLERYGTSQSVFWIATTLCKAARHISDIVLGKQKAVDQPSCEMRSMRDARRRRKRGIKAIEILDVKEEKGDRAEVESRGYQSERDEGGVLNLSRAQP
jgi:hypothetical protein